MTGTTLLAYNTAAIPTRVQSRRCVLVSEKVIVGKTEIIYIPDTTLDVDACAFFIKKSNEDMDEFRDYIDEDCKVKGGLNVSCFLVLSQNRQILIDCGLGPGPWESFSGRGGDLPEQMRSRGINVLDIDTVVTTHMHFDHIGWLVTTTGEGLQRTFPNARYVVPKTDWDLLGDLTGIKSPDAPNHFSPDALELFATSTTMRNNIAQMGNIELVSGEHQVTDEITIVPTPGHTPGHQSILVTSGGERAFIMGDVAHMPLQLQVPDWILAADVQPELGAKTRAETLDWLEREGLLVASGHFPAPGFGRVVRGQTKRYWQAI